MQRARLQIKQVHVIVEGAALLPAAVHMEPAVKGARRMAVPWSGFLTMGGELRPHASGRLNHWLAAKLRGSRVVRCLGFQRKQGA